MNSNLRTALAHVAQLSPILLTSPALARGANAPAYVLLAETSTTALGFGLALVGAASALAAGALLVRARRRQWELEAKNAELSRALSSAEELVRQKTEFVANISHELRTPLNSVVNLPEGLLEMFSERRTATCAPCGARFELEAGEVLPAQSQCQSCGVKGLAQETEAVFDGDLSIVTKHLRSLHRSGRHLMSLINDVLDFSKLEAGKMVLQRGQVRVPELFDELSDTLSGVAAPRGITLAFIGASAEQVLHADQVKTVQIFINLVGNAIKFSPDGGRVEISARLEDADCVITVADSGPGIAQENHRLIFESFKQVEGQPKKIVGTGLGLSITHKLVELHGGRVWVDSELGRGAHFHVRLPRWSGETSLPSATHAAVRSAAGRKRVLLLDDEPAAIETLTLALRNEDCEILTLLDPKKLQAAVLESAPDLIILDIMMPRLSGLTLLQELRASEPTRSLPILVSSAYHANESVVRSLGAAWIAKPWSRQALLETVRTLLGPSPLRHTGS